MFWWIDPVALTFFVLGIIDSIVCSLLIALDVNGKIIKFFMDLLFALLSLFLVFVVIAIIYEIWIEYIPA